MKRFLVGICLLIMAVPVFAQEDIGKADKDKAQFVFDLMNQVEWPQGTGAADGEFVIMVVGETPVTAALEVKAEEISKAGTKASVKTVAADASFAEADIVFIGTGELTELAKVLKGVAKTKALTVSDQSGFARYGVMVTVTNNKDTGKIGIEINQMAARNAGLKISQDLIKKADKTYG